MPLSSHRNANSAPPKESRRKPTRPEADEVIGRMVTLDPTRSIIEIEDERTDRRVRIDLKRARMSNVTDADGDGKPSITDLFPGDRVRASVDWPNHRLARAKSIWRIGPPAPVGGLRRLAS